MSNKAGRVLIFLCVLNLLFLGVLIVGTKETAVVEKTECPSVDETVSKDERSEKDRIIDSIGEDKPTILIAVIVKEEIPKELELGEYWYWAYFDEPYLLVNNAAGVPMYIDKIQVNPPKDKDFYDIEDFVDKRVEIYGYQTWGYAESSIFQILAIREL